MFHNSSLYLRQRQPGRTAQRISAQTRQACLNQSRKSRPNGLITGQLRITRMVMMVTCLYIIGNLPFSIYFPISLFGNADSLYGTIAYLVLYCYNGSSFFIFYYFNKHYRNILIGYSVKLFKYPTINNVKWSTNQEQLEKSILSRDYSFWNIFTHTNLSLADKLMVFCSGMPLEL